MKKTIALLAAAVLLLTLIVPAYAAGVTIDTSKTGSFTIYKYDMTTATGNGINLSSFVADGERDSAAEAALAPYAIQGVKFTYLKVADVGNLTTQPEDGKADVSLLYAMPATNKTAALLNALGLSYQDAYTSEGTNYYFTSDVLNAAVRNVMSDSTAAKNTLESYIKANGGTTLAETDANGRTTATGLPLGLYLIVETYVPENVTCTVNPFFVSVPMTTVDGAEWMYDITLYPKNETGNPTLEKTVRESREDTGKIDSYEHTATASIGDVVDYQIVSKLPTITSAASYLMTYTYVDTLSKGITYNKQDVTVSFYSDAALENEITSWTEEDGKFTVTYGTSGDSTTMTVAMTADGLNEINSAKTVYPAAGSVASGYADCYMVVRYSCTINADAVLGDAGNPNEVTLEWRRTNSDYYDTLKDDCHVYTYGLDLSKKFHDEKDADADGNFAFQAKRPKFQEICGAEAKIHAVIKSLNGKLMAVAVEMSIAAERRPIPLQKLQDLRALVTAIARRIVQEAIDLVLARRFQRGLQPDQLAFKYLIVVTACGGILLEKPAARSAQRRFFVKMAVVIQNKHILKAIFGTEFIELCRGRPPIVMVPLQNDLSAGNGVDKRKVRRRALHIQRPRQIAQQDCRILRLDYGQALAELVHVADPCAAEDVHGLIGTERKVQIADRVERHQSTSRFSNCSKLSKNSRSSNSSE